MAEYLITGGAGFIGSHLVEALVKQGKKVRVLDNFSSGKMKNIESFLAQIELIEGDIRNRELCDLACKGVKYVSHQAALGSVPASIDDPLTTHEVNETGTLNMLLAAKKAGVKRFVFASSSAVYGDEPELPKKESYKPAPKSPYALSKLTAETYCRLFTELYGLQTVSLRYFNIFGPRQDENGQYAAVIPKFCQALAKEESPMIFGDGKQTRDFCYIANVVEANLLGFEAKPEACGKAYNIACNRSMDLNELLSVLQNALVEVDKKLKVQPTNYQPARVGDIKDSYADYSLATECLGFQPLVSVEEGLKQTLEFYL